MNLKYNQGLWQSTSGKHQRSKVLYAQTCQQQDVGFNVSTDAGKHNMSHWSALLR